MQIFLMVGVFLGVLHFLIDQIRQIFEMVGVFLSLVFSNGPNNADSSDGGSVCESCIS
jgi:hypothetical protein